MMPVVFEMEAQITSCDGFDVDSLFFWSTDLTQ